MKEESEECRVNCEEPVMNTPPRIVHREVLLDKYSADCYEVST
jgi:hypothetical protein